MIGLNGWKKNVNMCFSWLTNFDVILGNSLLFRRFKWRLSFVNLSVYCCSSNLSFWELNFTGCNSLFIFHQLGYVDIQHRPTNFCTISETLSSQSAKLLRLRLLYPLLNVAFTTVRENYEISSGKVVLTFEKVWTIICRILCTWFIVSSRKNKFTFCIWLFPAVVFLMLKHALCF